MDKSIELSNAREEMIEAVDRCIKCGLCKELCPVFRMLREEQYSPRGHAILLSNKIIDKIVFSCSLCKACEFKCPLKLEICKAIRKARFILNIKGKENPEMKKIVKKVMEKDSVY